MPLLKKALLVASKSDVGTLSDSDLCQFSDFLEKEIIVRTFHSSSFSNTVLPKIGKNEHMAEIFIDIDAFSFLVEFYRSAKNL